MHEQQSTPQLAQNGFSRRAARNLSIQIQHHLNDSDISSADSDKPPFARKNMKGLSLDTAPQREKPRRPSIVSLPAVTLLHRRDEDTSSPYADGPVQVIPGIWIGSEDNARDWKGLVERGIRSILNVAKEVSSPFDHDFVLAQGLRSAVSTPNFRNIQDPPSTSDSKHYYPPHVQSGRPGMHYLKLDWSHGQQDLVNHGFKEGMAFVDAALNRGEGCLIHCQCGISRSATMVIALVMRAAAETHTYAPPEVWALRGMQAAYDYVKLKSPCVGPNMSLIYSLLEYEKTLKKPKGASSSSPRDSDISSIADDEEEWTRRRRLLDDEGEGFVTSPDHQNHEDEIEKERERECMVVIQEAKALDKAMEERIVARKSSASSMSSIGSVSGSGSIIGIGPNSWRSRRYARKRTPSILSTRTTGSVSEDLVEEDEERELLGIGGGFDNDTLSSSQQTEEESSSSSPDDGGVDVAMEDAEHRGTPRNGLGFPLWKSMTTPSRSSSRSRSTTSASGSTSSSPDPYAYPAPVTAIRSTFDLPPRLSPSPSPAPSLTKPKAKRRPPSLSLSLYALPPVPASPVALVIENRDAEGGAMTGINDNLQSTTISSAPSISMSTASIPTTKSIPANSQLAPTPSPMPTPIRRRSESRISRPSSSLRQSVLLSSSLSSSSSSSTSISSISKGSLRRSSESTPGLGAGMTTGLMTPSQTLFVFPPSPTATSTSTTMLNGPRTPSTMTLLSNPSVPASFTGMQTPSFGPGFGINGAGSGNHDGTSSTGSTTSTTMSKAAKRRSWILTSTPATVGLAKVDARGYVGFEVPLT